MSDSGGVTPPSSGSSGSSGSSPQDQLPVQVETGMGKAYDVKGDTAIRQWAQHFFPGMSGQQLDKFVEQFTMTICQQINQQIARALKQSKKAMERLKKAETGED